MNDIKDIEDDGIGETGGYYWHYISYSADQELFDQFRRVASDLAILLSLKIIDPQINNEFIEPQDYYTSNSKPEKIFTVMQQVTGNLSNKLWLYEPAESKYFIRLLIRSWDPKEDKQQNRIVSSKRVVIENVIRDVKIFRIIAEKYRNRRKKFGLRFNLIAAMYNLNLSVI